MLKKNFWIRDKDWFCYELVVGFKIGVYEFMFLVEDIIFLMLVEKVLKFVDIVVVDVVY